jgi:nucleoside-diphosphate kinase
MNFGLADSQLERTFVMVKPEGVQRGLVGLIIGRFEKLGLQLQSLKFIKPNLSQLKNHYREHQDRPYFNSMIEYLSNAGPVVVMVWFGHGSVAMARKVIGLTDPGNSCCGSLRGDFAVSVKRTAIHGADSEEAAEREIRIWFDEQEIVS